MATPHPGLGGAAGRGAYADDAGEPVTRPVED